MDAQVARLLDELPSRFTLAGLSLGGIVAMALVRTAPERVSSLILLSTNPYGPTEDQLQSWRASRDDLRPVGPPAICSRTGCRCCLSEPARTPELVELTLIMADEVGEAALDAQLALQATRIDERPALREVRCPTMIISARQDALCSVAKHIELNELIRNSALMIIEDCGHLSPLERPAALPSELG